MKKFHLIVLFIISTATFSQSKFQKDEAAIRNVLNSQIKAWNNHDLETFMQGYWKNDSLKFYSGNNVKKGWQKTLDNYKKGYPTKDHTGELKFTIKSISPIEENSYYVMGQYHLKRSVSGNAEGTFLIVFKKIDGHWKIIADMST
ncbi:YybH family protein [Corallibacter sp.]|uniref:YybH family protein n=1 Tax=Corallibacter sp. TaxID=2038084 RepID=UPI003AB5984B